MVDFFVLICVVMGNKINYLKRIHLQKNVYSLISLICMLHKNNRKCFIECCPFKGVANQKGFCFGKIEKVLLVKGTDVKFDTIKVS